MLTTKMNSRSFYPLVFHFDFVSVLAFDLTSGILVYDFRLPVHDFPPYTPAAQVVLLNGISSHSFIHVGQSHAMHQFLV